MPRHLGAYRRRANWFAEERTEVLNGPEEGWATVLTLSEDRRAAHRIMGISDFTARRPITGIEKVSLDNMPVIQFGH